MAIKKAALKARGRLRARDGKPHSRVGQPARRFREAERNRRPACSPRRSITGNGEFIPYGSARSREPVLKGNRISRDRARPSGLRSSVKLLTAGFGKKERAEDHDEVSSRAKNGDRRSERGVVTDITHQGGKQCSHSAAEVVGKAGA